MKISSFVGPLHYMARTTSSSLPRTSSTTQGTNHNVRTDGRRYVDYISNKLLRHLALSFSFEFCEYIINKSLAFFSLPSHTILLTLLLLSLLQTLQPGLVKGKLE